MRPEKAKEVLKRYLDTTDLDRNFDEEICQAFDEAFDALQKEIPKPVRITTSTKRCGACNRQLSGKGNIHPERGYCPGCGQCIDWKEAK